MSAESRHCRARTWAVGMKAPARRHSRRLGATGMRHADAVGPAPQSQGRHCRDRFHPTSARPLSDALERGIASYCATRPSGLAAKRARPRRSNQLRRLPVPSKRLQVRRECAELVADHRADGDVIGASSATA